MARAPASGTRAPEALLVRFRDTGDPEALGALFDGVAPRLFALALRLAPDAVTAEDALQETFLEVLRSARRFSPGRPALPWLVGILRRKVLEARRGLRRRPDPLRVHPPVLPPDPATEAERREGRDRIGQALEGLPEPYRGAALLRWRYGLEPAEIAHVRGEPPGTTSSILSRALSRLRRDLGALPVLLLGGRPLRGLAAVRREVLRAAGATVVSGVPMLLLGAGLIGGTLMAKKSLVASGAVALAALGGWLAFGDGDGTRAPSRTVPRASILEKLPPFPADEGAPVVPLPGDGVMLGRLVRGAPPRAIPGLVSLLGPALPARTAQAGENGRFRFEGLPRGVLLALEATAPGLVPTRRHGLTVPRQGDLDTGDILVGAGSRMEVLVRDLSDRPVAGARVSLHGTTLGGRDPLDAPALPPAEQAAAADAEGCVLFGTLAPGWWNVRATAAGFAARTVPAELLEGQEQGPVRIVLYPGHFLEGRVFGADGAPLPGAAVTAWWGRSSAGWSLENATAAADGQGRYRLEGLSPGAWRLRVRLGPDADRGGGLVQVPDVKVYDIHLSAGASVRGRVVDADSGEPLPGAEILLKVFGRDWGWAAHVRTASGPDGSFRADDLPPGIIFGIEASLPGYVAASARDELRVELGPGSAEERIVRLRRGASVAGTVRDEAGAPVPCARVSSTSAPHRSPAVTTGPDGAYRISPVPPGRTLLFAVAEGRYLAGYPVPPWQAIQSGNLPPECSVDVPASGEARKDLILRPAASVEGTVVDGAGRPVAGARVALAGTQAVAYVPGAVLTGPDGGFRFANLAPGEGLALEASGPRGARGTSEPFRAGEGETVRGIRVVLGPGAAISGTLRRADGEPLRGVLLRLVAAAVDPTRWWQQHDGPIRDATVVPIGPDGAFRAEGLAAGTWTLLAEAGGCAPFVGKPFPLAPGEVREGVEVVLAAEEILAGRVLAEDGAPVAGARLSAVPRPPGERVYYAGDEFQTLAVTDTEGRFEIGGLGQGNHVLSVRAAGFLEASAEAPAGTRDLVVRLGGGHPISGVVVERTTGLPVPGVRVSSQSVDPSPRFLNNVQAVSGPDGAFTLEGLAPGAYMVWTYGGDFVSTQRNRVEAGTRDLRILVERGFSIAGRALDAQDRPVAGQGIVWAMGVGPDGKVERGRSGTATLGDGGTFRIGGLLPGSYDLLLNPRGTGGSGPQASLRGVAAGAEGIVVRVPAGEPIRGRVVDDDGKPPEAAGIMTVTPTGSSSPDLEGAWVGIHGDGSFATAPLDLTRTYDLSVDQVPGHLAAAIRGVAPGTRDVVLRLRRARTIAGRVVDEAGRPVPEGVPLEARAPDLASGEPGSSARALTRPDGTFALEGLADTACRVAVGGRNSDFLVAEQDVPAGASGVELRAVRGVALSGRLLDAEGKAVPGARIAVAEGPAGAKGRWTRTAADGGFALRGLPSGGVRLQASVDERSFDLGAHEPPFAGLDLRLPPR